MFEARLKDGIVFKKIIDCIKDLCKEAEFECSEEGISVQALDSSHVSLVALKLNSEAFEHFQSDRPVNLGINMERLAKICKLCGPRDEVTLRHASNSDKITIVFEDNATGRVSEFDLALMEVNSEALSIPQTHFETSTEMSSNEFARIIRDLREFGDAVTIGVNKEAMRFMVEETTPGQIVLKPTCTSETPDENVNINVNEPVMLKFALRYLGFFSKGSTLSPRVKVSLSNTAPLECYFTLKSMTGVEQGSLRFYLAPKIQDQN
jgi:proliferating cell nuclear antigen